MVTKAEIFGSQGLLGGGIRETIKRRTAQSQKTKKEEENKQVNLYLEKYNAGEITNINQIPSNIRRYFNFSDMISNTRNEVIPELEKAKAKEQEIRQTYEKKLAELRDWRTRKKRKAKTSEAKKEISLEYLNEKADLQKDYKPDIEYYNELSKNIQKQINNLDKGELISSKFILDYSKNNAKYEQVKKEAYYKNEKISAKNELLKNYNEKLQAGKIEYKDIPFNYRRYFTVEKQEVIDIPKQEPEITPTISSILGIEEPTTPEFAKGLQKKYSFEVKRYKDIGYSKDDSRILAEESLRRGGITFVPQESQKIITKYKINKFNQIKNREIKDSFKRLVSGRKAYKVDTLRDTLDSIQEFTSAVLDKVQFKLTEKEYRNQLKFNNELQEAIRTGKKEFVSKGWDTYEPATMEQLKLSEKALINLEEKLNLGLATTKSKISTVGLDIASDVVIPGKAYVDISTFINQIIPREKDYRIFVNSINKDGIKETFNSLSKNIRDKILNFFTNKEQKEKFKEVEKQNIEEIEKVKKLIKNNEVEKYSSEQYIRELEEQNRQLKIYQKELNSNSLLNIGTAIFTVLTLGKGSKKKNKAKNVELDLETAKRSADYLNKLDAGKLINEKIPYVEDTYSNLKLNFDDIDYINNNILKTDKIKFDDIENVQIKINAKEYFGGYKVKKVNSEIKLKKPVIEKIEESLGKAVRKTEKLPYYVTENRPNYWQNTVDLAIQLKNGEIFGFSVVSKSKKPIQNYNSIKNSLRYGTNKKIIKTIKPEGSEYVFGVQSRKRGDKVTAEDYWIGKEVKEDLVGIKRKPKISEKRRLSSDEYWLYGEPVAEVETRKVGQQSRKIYDFASGSNIKQLREIGYDKIKDFDLKLDTSNFDYLVRNQLRMIEELPKQKTRSLLISKYKELSNKAKNVIRQGKNSILITSNELKSMPKEVFSKIQSAMSSIVMPKQKFNSVITKSKTFLNQVKRDYKQFKKFQTISIGKINKISSDVNAKTWTGVNNNQYIKIKSDIGLNKNSIDSQMKIISSHISLIDSQIKELNSSIVGITEISQVAQITYQINQLKTAKDELNILKNSLFNQSNNLNRIKETLNSIKKTIKVSKPKIKGVPSKLAKLKPNEYGIFTRTKGKDYLIGKNTVKKKAEKKLFDTMENTLRASGFIKKGNKKIRIKSFGDDFRRSKTDPWRVVEKRSSRIDTIGEKRELKKSKKRKVKSAEDFWFR